MAGNDRGNWGSRDLAFYYALAQTGLEMVAPIGLGAALDYWLGSQPWCTVVGAILGPIGGIAHMLILVKRHDEAERARPK